MKTDNIKNASYYYNLGESFKKGFDFLLNTNLNELANGKYMIDGDNLFVSVQDYYTKPQKDGRFEAHKKYADIQYIIKGEERMGVAPVDGLVPKCEYDDNADITFFESVEESDFVTVKDGDFVIFMPEDAHMPCISVDESTYIKKAVVKVKL